MVSGVESDILFPAEFPTGEQVLPFTQQAFKVWTNQKRLFVYHFSYLIVPIKGGNSPNVLSHLKASIF